MASRATTLINSLLLFSLLSLLLAAPTTVEGRQHARMAKVIRARANPNDGSNTLGSAFDPFSIENIGADPTDATATATRTGNGRNPINTATGTDTAAVTTPTGNPAGQDPSTDGGLLGGLTSLLPLPGQQNATATDTSTGTSTATTATTTNTTSTTTSATTSQTPLPQSTETVNSATTVTATEPSSNTSTPDANAASANNPQGASSNNGGGHIARNTIISIAAIGGSIGLAILLWTVFRKWKLRPTDSFEERLNPIDWNPTSTDPDMAQRDRKRASVGSNRSFVSADAHSMRSNNPNNNAGYLYDIPNHDFTAGPRVPNALAPGGNVGGGGGLYPELRRGPSRGPYDTRPNGGGYGATAYGGY